MEKLKKTARGLEILFRILFCIVVCLIILYIAGTMIFQFTSVLEHSNLAMTIHGMRFDELKTAYNLAEMRKIWIFAAMPAILNLIATGYGIQVILGILKPMKQGSPFADSVAKDIGKLARVAIGFGLLRFASDAIGRLLLLKSVPHAEHLSNIHLEVNISYFIVAAFLFLFSYIFKYGEELQRLSDETL